MPETIVWMTADKPQGLMLAYLDQLESAGVKVHHEAATEHKNELVTIGYRLYRAHRAARQYPDHKIVISDAFDVMLFGKDFEDKIPDDYVLLAGERNCYPDSTQSVLIEGPTPWKFANGGLLAGTSKMLLKWAEALQSHPLYWPSLNDQAFYNSLLVRGRIPFTAIDYSTELFYCAYQEKTELQFNQGVPHNTSCGTYPNFVHFSGRWPSGEILSRYHSSLGHTVPRTELIEINIPFACTIKLEVCEGCKAKLVEQGYVLERS